MVEATSHTARVKGEQVTVSSEADRQRGTPNPSGLRHPNAEPQAVTRSESGCSVVSTTRSNAVSGGAEPLLLWRRQYPLTNFVARPVEPSGVAGTACGEGCSREGGISVTVCGSRVSGSWLEGVSGPTRSRLTALGLATARGTISVTREERPDAVPEVGGDHSSREVPAMGTDAKGLRFRRVSLEAKGGLYSPKGVVKQA